MRFSKIVSVLLAAFLLCGVAGFVVGCGNQEEVTLKVGMLEESYGTEVWRDIKADFESSHENISLEVFTSADMELAMEDMLNNGTAPDVLYLPTGRDGRLTESLIANRSLVPLDDLLEKNVFGEDVKLKDKFLPGFLDTAGTNPYQKNYLADDSTYMLPLYYSPTGVFYNKARFASNNGNGKFRLSETFESLLSFRQTLINYNDSVSDGERLYLLGYQSPSYVEPLISSTIATYAGLSVFERMLAYDNVFEIAAVKNGFIALEDLNENPIEIGGGIGHFIYPESYNATADEMANIQAFVDGKFLYLPGDVNVASKIAEMEKPEGFEIGFMPFFGAALESQKYAPTAFNQIYILNHTKQQVAAEEFLLYLFSDRAARIISGKAKVVMPIKGGTEIAQENGVLNDMTKTIYDVYNSGARPLFTGFENISVDEADWHSRYVETLNNIYRGTQNSEAWLGYMTEAAKYLRNGLISNN